MATASEVEDAVAGIGRVNLDDVNDAAAGIDDVALDDANDAAAGIDDVALDDANDAAAGIDDVALDDANDGGEPRPGTSRCEENIKCQCDCKQCKRCKLKRCKTCPFINPERINTTTITGPTSASIQVRKHFTCETPKVVYCISCLLCHKFYIGQTGRKLKVGFQEHLNNIRCGERSSVSDHFNDVGSSNQAPVCEPLKHKKYIQEKNPDKLQEIISVCGLKIRSDPTLRENKKTQIIAKLGTKHPDGMN
uniref:uncharacterized protein n=1 Tax=Myxine glutinosa TaxID=7769 RepID=UPI00358E1BC5